MSWNHNALALVSDPCQTTKYGFSFAVGRSPVVRLGADIYAEVETPLADGSSKCIKLADPLRTGELGIGPYITRLELMQWRVFREYGHYCAIFPNYWTDTCVVTHFEDSLVSEIGNSPTMKDSGDATVTATYEAGPCGAAVSIVDGCYLEYDGTLPNAGTLGLWFKVPASGDLTEIGLFKCYDGTDYFTIQWVNAYSKLMLCYAYTTGEENRLDFGAARTQTAGSWHHVAITWSVIDPCQMNVYWDGALGDSTSGDISLPVFSGTWCVGKSRSYDIGTSAIEEVRLDPNIASAASVLAQYERLTETDELVIQEQLQGHYCRLAQGHFDPLTLQEGGKWAGVIAFTGRWSDPNQRVSRASVA